MEELKELKVQLLFALYKNMIYAELYDEPKMKEIFESDVKRLTLEMKED